MAYPKAKLKRNGDSYWYKPKLWLSLQGWLSAHKYNFDDEFREFMENIKNFTAMITKLVFSVLFTNISHRFVSY
jgi:hypothetical protein